MSDRGRGSRVSDGRSRRLFASMQSALGGAPPDRNGPRTRQQTRKQNEEQHENLAGLDEVIEQISDMTIRHDRSAMQIKRNIDKCEYLNHMTGEEWDRLSKTLCETAIQQSEADFVVDLFGSLLVHSQFCDVVSNEIARMSAVYIMEGTDDNIPSFLASILCASWPRGAGRASYESNPILTITVSIVQGWLIVIQGALEKSQPGPSTATNTEATKDEKEKNEEEVEDDSCSISSLDSDSDEDNDDQNIVEKEEEALPIVVNRCASAISDLCSCTQRSLWMKFPTLVDEIYEVIRPAITHCAVLEPDVKSSLLSTLILLHQWTRAKAVTTKSTSTQTTKV